MIAVIDYGMGNLRSVQKALQKVGAKAAIASDPAGLRRCEKLVLPGVGAFGGAMKELTRLKLVAPIKEAVAQGKPFLGLCLGLQLLFEKSEEAPGVKGLAILKGVVKKFNFTRSKHGRTTRDALKIPHMGWNNIVVCGPSLDPSTSSGSVLSLSKDDRLGTGPELLPKGPSSSARSILSGIPNGSYMYFVHSYYVRPKDRDSILTITNHGIEFVSGIRKDNIYAFQFHPEKSQGLGLRILRNFVRLR